MKVKSLSRVQLFVTPWTAAYRAPLSMGFSRQEYWSGVPLPSPNMSLGPIYIYVGRFFKLYMKSQLITLENSIMEGLTFCMYCLFTVVLFVF